MPGLTLEPSQREFMSYRGDANVVAVSCELSADLETPISAYLRLRDLPGSFLFESVEGGAQVARFSVLGGDPLLTIESDGGVARVLDRDGRITEVGPPLDVVRRHLDRYRAAPRADLPPMVGGFVGFLGYDAVRLWERLPHRPPDDLGLPVFRLSLMDTVVVFDHRHHTLRIVASAFLDDGAETAYRRARERIAALVERLERPRPPAPAGPAVRVEPRADTTPRRTARRSSEPRQYIRAGDIYQVILSQRFAAPVPGLDPLAVYRTLRRLNPSPYMFLLDTGGAWLAGASPERLVRLEHGRVDMRPLAGTRPRGANQAEDAALAAELLADPKERAEHVMLVDLARNDVGRVARYGSVRVAELMAIERYSHVMHLVSHVEGELDRRSGAWDVLQARLPARHGLRRAQGAGDGDHRRAGAGGPRPLRGRGGLPRLRRLPEHRDHHPDRAPPPGRRRTSRPAPGSSPTRSPSRSTRSASRRPGASWAPWPGRGGHDAARDR